MDLPMKSGPDWGLTEIPQGCPEVAEIYGITGLHDLLSGGAGGKV